MASPLNKSLKALLASASAGGTIAAVGNLAANEIIPRVISSERFLGAAGWSRNVTRTYSAPPEAENDQFLRRLLAIGATDPGQILLATSDQTAWQYTENAAALKAHFRVYQPTTDCMRNILDKSRFSVAAARAGLNVLPNWNPKSLEDVATLGPTLPYPILIKQRTHVNRWNNDKGTVAHSASDLLGYYKQIVERDRSATINNPLLSDVGLPMLQQFVKVAKEGVISITGFSDRTGGLFVTRRATKIFQRLGPLGVGVCFEALPPDADLSNAVQRLCRELDYFGIFEVEFLRFNGSWVAIDFNPRMFSQIGLDIYRGAPLPLMACLDAAGETTALSDIVEKAKVEDQDPQAVFFDSFTLNAILLAKALTGRISTADRAYWRDWEKRHAAHAVDFAGPSDDPMPRIVHALSETLLGLKAIPRFLRMTARPASPRGFAKGFY